MHMHMWAPTHTRDKFQNEWYLIRLPGMKEVEK